ncbi:uncharacterized protein TNCV_3311161 [Trichonephila clavipes]|nr:uncharacterized protein TNCV_3311161 [Trichonephila clavipes]
MTCLPWLDTLTTGLPQPLQTVSKSRNCSPPSAGQRGTKSVLSKLKSGIIIGAQLAGASESRTTNLVGISKTTVSRIITAYTKLSKVSSVNHSNGRVRAVVPTRRRTARATIDLLKDTLGDRLISRFGPVNWPPRSCDLTPLDYFLWGYVKSLVYADKPQTLDHLEDNIRRVIADIRPRTLEKIIGNWTSRLDYIRASRGSPVSEIIFKM